MLNQRINSYQPREWDNLSPEQRDMTRAAFNYGRDYESSITPDDYRAEIKRLRGLLCNGMCKTGFGCNCGARP